MSNADTQIIVGDKWRITVLNAALVRFEGDPAGRFVDSATQAVVARPVTSTPTVVTRQSDQVRVITDRFQLDYDGAEPSAAGLSVKGRDSYHSVWRYGLPLDNLFDDLVGYRTNLGGTARTLDTVDGPAPVADGVASLTGIAVLEDSTSFEVSGDGQLRPPNPGRVDVYVFTHGLDHGAAVSDLLRLTGTPPLIPRYAFGNWWSRYHRYSAEEYEGLMDRFAAEGLPFAVAVVDMDWHITDVDPRYGSGWTGYSWNRELFPDPEGFLRGLHDRGLAVSLNVHPADGIRAFEDCYSDVCAVMGTDPSEGLPVDFDLTDPLFRRAYFEAVHHPLEEMGVDFWWIDWQQGQTSRSGVDPLWLLNYFHTQDMVQRGRRPLILSRYAGPGAQRFPVGFSGDTIASWASLAFQPWFTATAANIGYGMWSHDIGGHSYGVRDDELALRWLQFGVLSPICRLHSTADPFLGKEPWKFRSDVAAIMGRFLRWRHELVPYLYTEWASGTSLVRPMYHTHGTSQRAYDVDNQYWLGSSLLVAPITSESDRESLRGCVRTWLPSGTWTDLLTGLRYRGDRMVTMHRCLDSVPVLAQPGAIIPHAATRTPASELPEELCLWVVVGADGSYRLVEDDGALQPRTATTEIVWNDTEGVLTIGPAEGQTSVLPMRRRWRARFVGGQVSGVGEREEETGALLVELGEAATTEGLVWRAPQPVYPGSNDVHRRMLELIDQSRTAAANKQAMAEVLDSGADPLAMVEALREFPVRGAVRGKVTTLPESLIGAATELIAAYPE